MTVLKTERLVLRRAVESDLDALHAAMSDPETMKYWSTLPHADIETTREWLRAMIDLQPGESDDFIITLDGQAIGKMGMWRIPQIGYFIARQHTGKGYASEALAAFIAHALSKGIPALTADVDPRNEASLALLIRAGFRETSRVARTWCIGGEWLDSVYLRLDAPSGDGEAIARA